MNVIFADIRTARASVFNRAALSNAGSKRQASAVCHRIGYLPTAEEQVRGTASIAHEPFAFADRQLIDGVNHDHLIAIESVGTPSKLFVYREIIIIILISVRERVMGEELQPVAHAFFGLDLQGVVLVVSVVAVIGSVDIAARRRGGLKPSDRVY